MFKNYLCYLFLFAYACLFSQQNPDFGSENSHTFYVSQLKNAKDQNFQDIVRSYESYIETYPNNVVAQIELCKFIGNSYWDEYEEYNLKYDETEACIEGLLQKYPTNAKVLIYRANNLYGEAQETILKTAQDRIDTHKEDWTDYEIAEINTMLGDYYQDEKWRSLVYYKKAQRLNNTLDLSYQLAKIYQEQGKDDLAKEVLLPNLEKDTAIWRMDQKANLLLRLKEPQKALELFDIIRQKDSTYIDNAEMAKVMTDLGDFSVARAFLVRDTIKEWGKLNAKQLLVEHDLAHSEATIALTTYRNLQHENSYDDFFGVKRLRIFFKNPLLQWKFTEVLHFLLLYVFIFLLFLIPYLWILPIYGLGNYLRKNKIRITATLNSVWNIRHFWVVSFMYLLATLLTILIFEYQSTVNYYFDLGNSYVDEIVDQSVLANEMILFVVCMAIFTLTVLGKKELQYTFKSNLRIAQMIGFGVLFVIFNRFFIKILELFVDLDTTVASTIELLSAQEEIVAVMTQKGFLLTVFLVAVVVPIYEEIIFRGVILGSVERYLGFKGANVIQGILFALVHDNLALFPFFFVFAIITGYWVKKSGGLLTGIFLHGIHNFTVLIAVYYVTKLSVFNDMTLP